MRGVLKITLLCALAYPLSSCHDDAGGSSAERVDGEVGKPEAAWVTTEPSDWQELQFGGEGSAQWRDGVLTLDAGLELTGTQYRGKLPEIPYELQLEARKMNGSDFFCALTFPLSSEGTCATFIAGGWGGGTIGISSIDGLDASENETTSYGSFEKQQWYAIRVRVEPARLAVFIDDKQVVDLLTTGRNLGLRPGVIGACAPMGLAAWQTASELRCFRWRSLTD